MKATLLAQQSRASQIDVDTLLAALDASTTPDAFEGYCKSDYLRISTESWGYAFSLNNTDWIPVSPHAAKALRPFIGRADADHFGLREALLAYNQAK